MPILKSVDFSINYNQDSSLTWLRNETLCWPFSNTVSGDALLCTTTYDGERGGVN